MGDHVKDCRLTTDVQRWVLESLMVAGPAPVFFAEAAKQIVAALAEVRARAATPRQRRFLRSRDLWYETMNWGEASDLIGWIVRLEKGVD
jgi:hypothetical protein